MESNSLSEALSATETVVAAPAPVASDEQTDATDQDTATDSSLSETSESVVEQETKPEEEAPKEGEKAEAPPEPPAVAQLREWGKGLETDLKALQGKLSEVGGESHLQIMAPMLAKAAEIPAPGAATEKWSEDMWGAVNQSFVPEQVKALKSEAAWAYLREPASQAVIVEDLYGKDMTPQLLQSLVDTYRQFPDILTDPNETPENRVKREAQETRERDIETRVKATEEAEKRRDDEYWDGQFKAISTHAVQIALAPRVEEKKRFGLEFQKSDKDTPEIASFKERASKRYDQITTLMLSTDFELNQLANTADSWAKQRDEAQDGRKIDRSNLRQKAITDFAPLMEQRTRAVCAQIAKELAEDLKFLSPELSDRAKANNLKDLPAQVLGGARTATASGDILNERPPDFDTDPRGYAAWVSKQMTEQQRQSRTPGVLLAG